MSPPPRARLVRRLFLSVFLSLVAIAPACGGEPPEDDVDPQRELRARLDLERDREIHRIALGGRGSDEHVAPARISLGRRAIVEFVTVDGRIHTVTFPEDSLAMDAALFLRRTSQLRSPPLVDRGSRFVLTFEDAPPGRYPFRSDGPGGEAWGLILVGEGEEVPRDR